VRLPLLQVTLLLLVVLAVEHHLQMAVVAVVAVRVVFAQVRNL
jgi:hypothetical protein